MATRFYLPASGTAPLGSLAVDSGWTRSDNLERRPCGTSKSNTSLTQKSAVWQTTSSASWVWVQFQSKRLAAAYSWTTADTVSMVVKVAESVAQVDSHLAYNIRVVSGDGVTIRGIIGTYKATSSEYPTTLATIATRIHDARTGGATNFSSQAGDRIIIEIGHWGVTPSLATVYHNYGDPEATQDFPLTAGDVNDYCPWVELSRTVSFDLTSSKSAYLNGGSTSSSSKSAYLSGANPSYPASSNKTAYTKGSTSATPSNKSAYTRGSVNVIPANKSAYLKGGIIAIPSSKPVYLKGKADFITNKPAYIQGSVIAIPASKSAYLKGSVNITDSQVVYTSGLAYGINNKSAFTQGSLTKVENKSAFIQGSIDITSSILSFLLGGISIDNSIHAYTEGYSVGGEIVTNKPAFTIGIDNNLIPDGDINKVGVWRNELEQTTNLYLSVDETIADDNDYVYNTDPIGDDYIEFNLSNPSGTPGSGDVVIFVRVKSKTNYPGFVAQLLQGSTPIATRWILPDNISQTYYYTLIPAEKANITDWTDLRIKIIIDMS